MKWIKAAFLALAGTLFLGLIPQSGDCAGGDIVNSPAISASAAPAGSYIYDSFTSPTTVTLENHVGETGSTWKRIGGLGDAWIDPNWNAMYTTSDVTFANLGSIPTADYSVTANIHCFTSSGNSGVNGRVSTSGAPSRYFAIFTHGLGWGLYYADGFGNESRFGSLYGPKSLTSGRDYKVELRVEGSNISMYVDGVLAASGTSTKNAAAGYAGFETTGSGPGQGIVMLDFQVSALNAGTSYTLTYSAGPNGTISGTTPQTVTSEGSGTQVTAVPNTGYHFVSWSDGLTTASRTDTNVTSNISVTASFAADAASYTLTYSAGPNGTISGTTPQTVISGGSGTQVTAVPNTGYHFVSWSDGLATASRTDTNVTSNISVTASFALTTATYTLTYKAGRNGTISGKTRQTVPSGGSGTQVTAVPKTGYHFVSWSDGLTTASRTDTNVISNISVTASFAANSASYTLTYSAGPNGSISGTTPQTVPGGGSGTQVTAVPNTGYHFVSWSDGLTTAARTDTNVTSNISVTASFALDAVSYTLTYSSDPNGTISGTTLQTVPSGGSGTQVTAVPNTGYHFVSWSDGLTTASRTDTNVTSNISVTASYAVDQASYTLTYSSDANGTISGDTIQTISFGGSGTQVTAIPNTGFQFVSWSDGLTTASRTDTNVIRDISVTANFTASGGGETYIYDSFTSSSTVTLESHTAETGSTWSRVGGSGSASLDPTIGGVYSSTSVVYGNSGVIPSSDYSVIATIRAFSSAGGTNIGVNGRLNSGIPSRYLCVFTQGLGWGLYYANGLGTLTRIGTLYGPKSLTAGQIYIVELRMIGSTVSMYVDGVLAATGTDTNNSAVGRAGIEITGVGPAAPFEILDFKVTTAGP